MVLADEGAGAVLYMFGAFGNAGMRTGKVGARTINEGGGCGMRGLLLTALLLACCARSAGAAELHFEQENAREGACPGGDFDVGLALENATLYQQVYVWMHEKDVEDWNYSRGVRFNGTADADCALVSYTTFVESPTFFARLLHTLRMSVRFPIEVSKTVCVEGQSVVEEATIHLPLVQELRMRGRYEVRGGEVKSTIEAAYSMPWYIEFLVHDVGEHLRANFKEKVDALARSLCTRRTSAVGLGVPAQRYMLQELRVQSGRTWNRLHPVTPGLPGNGLGRRREA